MFSHAPTKNIQHFGKSDDYEKRYLWPDGGYNASERCPSLLVSDSCALLLIGLTLPSVSYTLYGLRRIFVLIWAREPSDRNRKSQSCSIRATSSG